MILHTYIVSILVLFIPSSTRISKWYHFPSAWRISFHISCSMFLLVMKSFSPCMVEKVLFLPVCLKDMFLEHRILGWHFFFRMLATITLHCFFKKKICCVPCLYFSVYSIFSLVAFKIFSLPLFLSNFIMMCHSSLCVYVCVWWILCSFLGIWVYNFHHIWEKSPTIISLNIFISSLSFRDSN